MNTIRTTHSRGLGRVFSVILLGLACLAPLPAASRVHFGHSPRQRPHDAARGDYAANLARPLTVYINGSPLEDAVAAVCDSAGIPYRHGRSTEHTEAEELNVTISLDVHEMPAGAILDQILERTGLSYRLNESGLFLYRFGREPRDGGGGMRW